MPQQQLSAVENNFTKGFVTEFTGLNFPENAATDCDNVQFSLIGHVDRRFGIDLENPHSNVSVTTTGKAISTYVWNNAGGTGNVKLLVSQLGSALSFYRISDATIASPLSNQFSGTLSMLDYVAAGATFDVTKEFQYADGNGYLFVYHPSCDPVYITDVANVFSASRITIKTRDFQGVEDNQDVNYRAPFLSDIHLYNLQNQGWALGSNWSALSNSVASFAYPGAQVFVVAAGLPITVGEAVSLSSTYDNPVFPGQPTSGTLIGTVAAYAGVNLTINCTGLSPGTTGGQVGHNWLIVPSNYGPVNTWAAVMGVVPSNADVWWYYRDATNVFNPATTKDNVTVSSGRAPQGHFIFNEFIQDRAGQSGLGIITGVSTTVRPRTGAWYAGRAWYTGVDANFPATVNALNYSWTENIYFSKIVSGVNDLGICYQQNDPTSEKFFDLLSTDGGVIRIQGCGSIYKLFPIQNGMLVFASNGIWFITGSQGIGFTANDYTITKISSVRSISSTSFVDVNGLPYFWNEEGIYAVTPSDKGGLTVDPITVTTILSYYNDIPLQSKKYVRGSYDPIEYTIKWIYRDTNETTVTNRYYFNKILNFNTYNKAFYPFTVDAANTRINGINYVVGSGGTTSPLPMFKYLTALGTTNVTFSEEKDVTYTDWAGTANPVAFESHFVTGYRLRGQAQKRFQMPYIFIYCDNEEDTAYKLQGLWDYTTSGNTGRWSTAQYVANRKPNYGIVVNRMRIRGQGLVLQLKVTSVTGKPFAIIGWSSYDTTNTGV